MRILETTRGKGHELSFRIYYSAVGIIIRPDIVDNIIRLHSPVQLKKISDPLFKPKTN